MKKFLITAIAIASTCSFATTSTNNAENKQPIMILTTVDTSGKVLKPLNSTVYSVSKKNIELCWEVINTPFIAKNKVVEIFKSPGKAKFTVQNQDSSVINEDKTHTITSYMTSSNNEFIRRCWKFDKNDPLGTYTLDLQINDIIFPTQKFTVTK